MFSGQYNINEAVDQVGKLSHYFFSDNFINGINELNKKTGLTLEPVHIRKASYSAQISESCIAKLREMLDKEYIFLDRVQRIQSTAPMLTSPNNFTI